MTVRTYDQDVADVLAVQNGDSEAWMRIRRAYAQLIKKVADDYEKVFDEDEAIAMSWSAVAEYVMTLSEDDAKFLRNKIRVVATEALNLEMHPGIPRTSLWRLRKGSDVMRKPVEIDDLPQMTLAQAADHVGVSVGALENYRMLARSVSFDALLEDSFDEENPYDQDLAGGYVTDDVDPSRDTELSNRKPLSSIIDIPAGGSQQTLSAKAQVHEAVESLPARQRAVVALFMQGFEDDAIADELGISRSTVRVHRNAAFQSLRSLITL